MKKKSHSVDMCTGSLAAKIILFALPLMAANVLQLMFNLADVIVVGKFAGDLSQAAVTSTGSLVSLLLGLFIGLAGGANVVVARALGAGRRKEVEDVVHTCILLGVVCGVVLAVAGAVAAPILLTLMKSPEQVRSLSVIYLRIYFLGVPATLVYNFASAILRADGDTKRPLYFLTLAGVVNVVLNLIFVILFHMGVAGVAIATAASQWMSAILVVRCLQNEEGALHLDLRRLRIHLPSLGQVAYVGIPAGIQSSLFSLSNTVVQSSVNSLGEIVMAGYGAALTVQNICYQLPAAFYYSVMPFVSQNYGAKKIERVSRSFLLCQGYAVLCSITVGMSAVAASPVLLSVFTDDPQVVEQGVLCMRYVTTTLFLAGMMDISSGALRGVGRSVMPMVVTLAGACGLRIVWMTTVFRANPSPGNIYVAYPISWAVTASILMITLFFVLRRTKRAFAAEGEGKAT